MFTDLKVLIKVIVNEEQTVNGLCQMCGVDVVSTSMRVYTTFTTEHYLWLNLSHYKSADCQVKVPIAIKLMDVLDDIMLLSLQQHQ